MYNTPISLSKGELLDILTLSKNATAIHTGENVIMADLVKSAKAESLATITMEGMAVHSGLIYR